MSTALFYRHHRSLEEQDLRRIESPGMASRLHHSRLCALGDIRNNRFLICTMRMMKPLVQRGI